jgi:predicted O-linked N-acetylglucosamine transferase (SPINDLY family)
MKEAVALHQSGQLAAAEKLYRQARAAAPQQFDALYLSGVLALQEGRTDDALDLLTRAHRVNRKSVICQVRLAMALMNKGRAPEAEAHLRDALKRDPGFAEGWDWLAVCLRLQDRLVDAVECHERAVALAPGSAAFWVSFGLTYSLLGYPEKALPCHDRALELDPRSTPARSGRAQTLHQLQRLPEAIAEYDRVLEAAPDSFHIRSCRLYAMHHVHGISREQLFREHVTYGQLLGEGPAPSLPNRPVRDRRLRLAVLSPDLREHSCAYFLLPLLQHLDAAQFEVCLYHDHFRTDAMSARLQALAAVWRNFCGQPRALVEQTIRNDAPDILIDLAGHTGISDRLPLFACRLAPLQITYLGYPNTTGVAAMDYRFTDAIADPVGEADQFATEKLVRFAPTAWAYSPPPDAPALLPYTATERVTFGCFNTPAKWTQAMAAVWARLLRTMPDSRLLLKGARLELPETRSRYQHWFMQNGVAAERVTFLPSTPSTAEHLACYRDVDVALDTFPYHGTTTTCEALWMGVPVVTLRGNLHVSRVGASLLNAIGHPEMVATTDDEYVRIAADLARDVTRRHSLHARLREEMQNSVLLDHPAQSARFAAALRECWERWCLQQGAV